jgi:hypothetical protein
VKGTSESMYAKMKRFRAPEVNGIDVTPLRITMNEAPHVEGIASLRRSNPTASTRVHRRARPAGLTSTLLRDASERHDGQMLPAAAELHGQLPGGPRTSACGSLESMVNLGKACHSAIPNSPLRV